MVVIEEISLLLCLSQIGVIMQKVLSRTGAAFHDANNDKLW